MLAASEKPACSITTDAALAAPTSSFTCGAFFPVVFANSALHCAATSFLTHHQPTSTIGTSNVVSDLSTIRTVRDGQPLFFHKPRFYAFEVSDSIPCVVSDCVIAFRANYKPGLMTNTNQWNIKHQKEVQAGKRARLRRYIGYPFTLLLGFFLTAFLNQWVVSLLPGPNVVTSLNGFTMPNNCVAVLVVLNAHDPIDSSYLRLAFPTDIKDAVFGYPSRSVSSENAMQEIQGFMIDTQPGCAISDVAVKKMRGFPMFLPKM